MMRSIVSFLGFGNALLLNTQVTKAFQTPFKSFPRSFRTHITTPYTSTNTALNNFFKDLLGSAFENDSNLSADKSEQQLEGPYDDFNIFQQENEKTEVQKRWLESQSKISSSNTASSSSFSPSLSSQTGKGAPINPDLLGGTKWSLNFYLVGTPDFDPNNSLYGSKVNMSTRKDSDMAKDGFAIGADALPEEPSTSCEIEFLDNGVCQISEGAFTRSFQGEWKLSDDGRMIRFSVDVKGYQKTVTTKGSIQNVYWSDREDVERRSSATYSIPSGVIYAEAGIGYGSKPGVFTMAIGDSATAPGGLLKVEKRSGAFGVTRKMLACGKFSAEMNVIE